MARPQEKMWEAPHSEQQPAHTKADDFDTVRIIAKRCGYSAGHVRKLINAGNVKGRKIGNIWLTTERAVKAYRKK